MRFLHIVRHCEALPGPDDYARELSPRGQAQAGVLRRWVEEGRLEGPVTALVSSARRTRQTFALGFYDNTFVRDVHYSDLIYNGRREVTAEDLLIDVAAVDPVTTNLLVVAHNPTVWELAVTLGDELDESFRSDYPVGGVVTVQLRDDETVGLRRYHVERCWNPDDEV